MNYMKGACCTLLSVVFLDSFFRLQGKRYVHEDERAS